MKKLVTFLFTVAVIMIFPTSAIATESNISVVINGQSVVFTEDSGYPYIDENYRTMVPLRITMESTGAAVGYDSENQTAIVITQHGRIEVPIGTDYLYYNNKKILNDTFSVAKDGRTYLPIRAVLEAAHYTVEWDASTNSVIVYNFDYNSDELVPYGTGSLETLVRDVLAGDVVYINGQYYATPEYVKMLSNPIVHYLGNDLNTAIYPQQSRDNLANFTEADYEWISGTNLQKRAVSGASLSCDLSLLEEWTEVPGYYWVYGLFKDKLIYAFPDMTEEFMNADNAEGVFSGIHMKKENGILWYDYQDLKMHGIQLP